MLCSCQDVTISLLTNDADTEYVTFIQQCKRHCMKIAHPVVPSCLIYTESLFVAAPVLSSEDGATGGDGSTSRAWEERRCIRAIQSRHKNDSVSRQAALSPFLAVSLSVHGKVTTECDLTWTMIYADNSYKAPSLFHYIFYS